LQNVVFSSLTQIKKGLESRSFAPINIAENSRVLQMENYTFISSDACGLVVFFKANFPK
jgi:hypothetical protein